MLIESVFFPNVKPIFNDDKDCCTNIGIPKPKVSPLILILLSITLEMEFCCLKYPILY